MGETIQGLIKLQRKKQKVERNCSVEAGLVGLERGERRRFRLKRGENVKQEVHSLWEYMAIWPVE